jgi:3-oxoacyl-[acyl-carrier protein] reductase
VLVASNDARKTEETAVNLTGEGHLHLTLDIRREEDCRRLAEFISGQSLDVQVLVNSAGISLPRCVPAPDFEEWNRPIEVMLYGAVYLCRHLAPHILDGGRIIHVTSIHHEGVIDGSSAYGMAKAALTQYTRSLWSLLRAEF